MGVKYSTIRGTDMDTVKTLQDLLLDVLSDEYYQSTVHLIEALRSEQAKQFNEVTAAYAGSYRLSKCGIMMSPVTLVSEALKDMAKQGLADSKSDKKGNIFWRLRR